MVVHEHNPLEIEVDEIENDSIKKEEFSNLEITLNSLT